MTNGTGSNGSTSEQTTDGGTSSGEPTGTGGEPTGTGGEPETCVWQDLWTSEPVPPLFSSTQPHFTVTEPEAADLDGDGDIDFVTADLVADAVQLWRNDGAGVLELAGTLPAGFGPNMAATALVPEGDYRIQARASDLDGDGDLDLVVGGSYMPWWSSLSWTSYYRVLHNDGAWQFSASEPVPSGGHDVEVGEIDGDGVPDLVLPGDPLTIALGDGAGGFPDTAEVPILAREVSLGDLDGDGDLDALIRGAGLHVGLNDGGVLSFGDLVDAPPDYAEILGDLDGDGDLDAAALEYPGPDVPLNVFMLANDGVGGFTPVSTGLAPFGFYGSRVRAADLDGDGDLDLTMTRYEDFDVGATEGTWPFRSYGLHVLRNDGFGTFTHEKYQLAPALAAAVIADFDGDAAPDLALAGGQPDGDDPSGVRVALNDGAGRFVRRSWPVGHRPEQIVAADLDGDGDDDLVTANSGSGDATILVNVDGDLLPRIPLAPVSMTLPAVERVEAVEPADFDGDGLVDLAIASDKSRGVWLFRNLGDLAFAQIEGVELTLPEAENFWPEGLAAGDLDGDGDPDLVTANGGAGRLGVFENLGDATFVLAAQPEVGSGLESVVAVDVDGDGALDLVAAAEGDDAIGVVRNASALTFGPAETYALPGVPDALAAGDLDGDGRPELIAAISKLPGPDMVALIGQEIAVLWNDGDGGYGAPAMIPVGLAPRGVAVGDGDGDGDLDVLVAAAGSDAVTVLINDGGTLTAGRVLQVGPYPMGVVFAALDTTCGLDIAVSSKFGDDVLVIPGL